MVDFDAVLFDAGGVLVTPDPAVMTAILAPYGATDVLARHHRAHYAGMTAKSATGAAETAWGPYDRAYAISVGVTHDFIDHAVEVLEHMRSPHLWRAPIRESVTALRVLGERGIPMGVVSNASGQIEAELARQRICQGGEGAGVEMRVIIDSQVVGVAKPDPRIFDFALAHFTEFERHRIAYIGDSVTMDIGGAEAAGLLPILIDPYDDQAGAKFERIRSLAELL